MRILALDLGERRIGVAVSDPTGTLARPVAALERVSKAHDLAAIGELVAEHRAALVVVGYPLTLRGEVGPQAQQMDQYAQALREALAIPVQMWDERYSTVTAEEILRQTRKSAKRRDPGEVDAVAAAVILQAYLDSKNVDAGASGEEL